MEHDKDEHVIVIVEISEEGGEIEAERGRDAVF
jgi:hypothetical protein